MKWFKRKTEKPTVEDYQPRHRAGPQREEQPAPKPPEPNAGLGIFSEE